METLDTQSQICLKTLVLLGSALELFSLVLFVRFFGFGVLLLALELKAQRFQIASGLELKSLASWASKVETLTLGKSKWGLSKRGLSPKGANWTQKGSFGGVSAASLRL